MQTHNGAHGSGDVAGHWTQWPYNFAAQGYGYYQFDLTSVLDPADVITAANVVLTQFFNAASWRGWAQSPEGFLLESAGGAWDEMTLDWNSQPSPATDGSFSESVAIDLTAQGVAFPYEHATTID